MEWTGMLGLFVMDSIARRRASGEECAAESSPAMADGSRMRWIITLTLTIPNIYHTVVMRAIGVRRRLSPCAGGGPCQPSNRGIQNLWRKTYLARGPPMLPMVRCSHSTGQRHGAGSFR